MNANTLTILAALSTSALSAQTVLQVGPSGSFPTIQAAVDAAVDGDFLQIAPGSYPSFAVDGKSLRIFGLDPATGNPSTFDVVATPNTSTPAIALITAVEQQLIVDGAVVDHADATAPAISITGTGFGDVRLSNCRIRATTTLASPTTFDGLIDIAGAQHVWLSQINCLDVDTPSTAPSGRGVAAVASDSAYLHVHACLLRGMSAPPGLVPGDAVRIRGDEHPWITSSLLIGGRPQPNGGPVGGHALHDIGGNMDQPFVCTTSLVTSNGAPTFAVQSQSATLPPCLPAQTGGTAIAADTTIPIGTATTIDVVAAATVPFVTWIGFGFTGIPWATANTPPYGLMHAPPDQVVGSGQLNPSTSFPLSIPNDPALIGTHLTTQSSLLDPNGNPAAFTTAASIVIR